MGRTLVAGALLFALVACAPAHAAFPGTNGKIVFSEVSFATDYEIYLVNPDGSGKTPLTSNSSNDWWPAWSADGTKIAFSSDRDGNFEIYTMNADGTGQTRVTNNANQDLEPSWSPTGSELVFTRVIGADQDLVVANGDGTGEHTIADAALESQPAWSPDGGKIAFFRSGVPSYGIYLVNPDGTGAVLITPPEFNGALNEEPNWSPDGGRIVFSHDGCGSPCDPDTPWEVTTMNRDGSDRTEIECCFTSQPAWSPDRAKVVYYKGLQCQNACATYDLATVNSSGGSVTVLPNTGEQPDWQPIPYTGYPRPKGATPLRVPLVVAYKNCAAPNEQHGPPLAYPSCAPPAEQSDSVTTGTADSNGQATQFVGSLRLDTVPGNPSTPADEANVKAVMNITDVRRKDNMLDYVGDVQATIVVRITDRWNSVAAGGGTDRATMLDIPFPIHGTCAATADPAVGSTCGAVTSLDAIVPNAIREGQRSIWQMGQVEVSDGGEDGSTGTAPNTTFARQGIFVP